MAQVQALSKSNPYNFLKGVEPAEGNQFLTPLEYQSAQVKSFAAYNTGAVSLEITPEIMRSLEALREIQLSTEFRRLASFVQTLQSKFPMQDGLLTSMVNPAGLADKVPFYEVPEDFTEDDILECRWDLSLQGDYAVVEGVPVWERLDGERVDFYNLFKLFRDCRYGLLSTGEYVVLSRSMAGLARKVQLAPQMVATLARIYNWQLRCDYYDRFFEKEMLRKKQIECKILQQGHLQQAMKLLTIAMDYFEKNPACAMKPKDAIAMAELGFKVSRLSIGLLPEKPEGSAGEAASLSINAQITKSDSKTINLTQNNFVSETDQKLQEDLKDNKNLLSILHVLQRSGAMATALQGELLSDQSEEDIIDVTAAEIETVEEVATGVPEDTTTGNSPMRAAAVFYVEPEVRAPAGFEEV